MTNPGDQAIEVSSIAAEEDEGLHSTRFDEALQLLIQEGEDHSLQLLQTSNHVMDSFSSLATDWVHEVSKAKRISVIENHNIGRALLPAKSFLCGDKLHVLILGPRFVTLRDDFFGKHRHCLQAMLEKRGDVTELFAVPDAAVPSIELKFGGVPVEVTYAKVKDQYVLPDVDPVKNPYLIETDEQSVLSMRRFCVMTSIMDGLEAKIVPHYMTAFQALQGLLTATGIYSGRMGFLCGESLAIMLAYVTQAQPSIGPSALVEKFLQTFGLSPWPNPIRLGPGEDVSRFCKLLPWGKNETDRNHVAPILAPGYPHFNVAALASNSTANMIKDVLLHALSRYYDMVLTSDPTCSACWMWTVESWPLCCTKYLEVQILTKSSPDLRPWFEKVHCAMPHLIELVEAQFVVRPCTTPFWPARPSPKDPYSALLYLGLLPKAGYLGTVDLGPALREFGASVMRGRGWTRELRVQFCIAEPADLARKWPGEGAFALNAASVRTATNSSLQATAPQRKSPPGMPMGQTAAAAAMVGAGAVGAAQRSGGVGARKVLKKGIPGNGGRVVSPPTELVSRALMISGLVRPYRLVDLERLLAENGAIASIGVTKRRDICYVVYAKPEHAVATRDHIYGLQWPSVSTGLLVPKFVGVGTARAFIASDANEMPENVAESGVNARGGAAAAAAAAAAARVNAARMPSAAVDPTRAGPSGGQVSERPAAPKRPAGMVKPASAAGPLSAAPVVGSLGGMSGAAEKREAAPERSAGVPKLSAALGPMFAAAAGARGGAVLGRSGTPPRSSAGMVRPARVAGRAAAPGGSGAVPKSAGGAAARPAGGPAPGGQQKVVLRTSAAQRSNQVVKPAKVVMPAANMALGGGRREGVETTAAPPGMRWERTNTAGYFRLALVPISSEGAGARAGVGEGGAVEASAKPTSRRPQATAGARRKRTFEETGPDVRDEQEGPPMEAKRNAVKKGKIWYP